MTRRGQSDIVASLNGNVAGVGADDDSSVDRQVITDSGRVRRLEQDVS